MDRRQALAALGAGAAGIAAWRWMVTGDPDPTVTGTVGNVRGLPPEITPNRRFYTVSKNLFSNPSVDSSTGVSPCRSTT